MNSKFQAAIVIGTSTIAFHCAKKLTDIGFVTEIIEYQLAEISPLSQLCKKENIPFSRQNKKDITNYLISIDAECLIISAFNTYLFPPEVTKRTNLKIINYHNSLLPKYAGRNAEAWAIFMQENESGITWHYVTDAIDNGNIICQKAIILSNDITSLQLLKKQHILAATAFDEILPEVITGMPGKKQNPPDSCNMYYAKDVPGEGILNINWDKNKISAFLRAMDYGPLNILGSPKIIVNGVSYAWSKHEIIECEYQSNDNEVCIDNDMIIIRCKDANILLKNIRNV
jgi:methionyl-tRNA formyltransferase